MRQMILRIAIALVAFGAGVTVSAIYNAIFGSSPVTNRYNYIRTEPMKRGGCSKSFRSVSDLPPPPPAPVIVAPAVPDVPPPPAAPKPTIKKRVTVKLPDGTVNVVESTVETRERKF